eukprot:TRINITY_DN13722_c0_g1_i1.p1 TRINITY_DN13722_c0_g1~~TRINITY_DN13722_c0_g1_i1.p1  ORF type:complete len:280 (-),score=-28.56 TRINITY_DN13722_c0_g1_i1:168-1007(-)
MILQRLFAHDLVYYYYQTPQKPNYLNQQFFNYIFLMYKFMHIQFRTLVLSHLQYLKLNSSNFSDQLFKVYAKYSNQITTFNTIYCGRGVRGKGHVLQNTLYKRLPKTLCRTHTFGHTYLTTQFNLYLFGSVAKTNQDTWQQLSLRQGQGQGQSQGQGQGQGYTCQSAYAYMQIHICQYTYSIISNFVNKKPNTKSKTNQTKIAKNVRETNTRKITYYTQCTYYNVACYTYHQPTHLQQHTIVPTQPMPKMYVLNAKNFESLTKRENQLRRKKTDCVELC